MQNAVFQTLLNVLMAEMAVLAWVKLLLLVRELRRPAPVLPAEVLPPG